MLKLIHLKNFLNVYNIYNHTFINKKFKNCNLLVIRILSKGKLGNSKPCLNCLKYNYIPILNIYIIAIIDGKYY